jgi:hypothetical protein
MMKITFRDPVFPRRMYAGGIPSGEVPAILQTGEEVLSRRQVAEGRRGPTYTFNLSIPNAQSVKNFAVSRRQLSERFKHLLKFIGDP